MDERIECPLCGAFNSKGATFCSQCFGAIEGTRVQPTPSTQPSPISPVAKPRDSYWKWRHIWIFGIFAWGLPTAATVAFAQAGLDFGAFLDASLALQITGYALAVLIAAIIIKAKGLSWDSLGLTRGEDTLPSLLRGAGFGAILMGIWLPIGLILSGGRFELDVLTGALVGETSGPGLLLASVVLVAGAPFIEEIYYRGMMFGKFANRNALAAVFGTSVLFVMAHGSLFIPALLLLGFGLGIRRLTKDLWYVIGAHGSWNLIVVVMAAWIFLGPATTFSPADDAYSLRHSANWQRDTEQEGEFPGGQLDLVLESTNGSAMAVGRLELPQVPEHQMLDVLAEFLTADAGDEGTVEPTSSNLKLNGLPATVQVSTSYEQEGTPVRDRFLIAIPRGAENAFFFNVVCPAPSCAKATSDFEKMLTGLTFN
jgi:membrane protease YdiL (CAAX protease family)